jgi:hypothetical protein
MNTFPTNIPKPVSITESFNKKQHRTPFEDGSVQSRTAHTRGRGKWDLSYEVLSVPEVYILRDFFYANQGALFYWTHPVTGTQYEARFSSDEFTADIMSPTNCSLTLQIEES